MLSKQNIALFSLVVVGILLVLALADFMALHDIQQDYVSPEVLSGMDLDIAGSLPYWTATSGEWTLVTISFIARLLLLLANTIPLFWLLRKEKQSASS